MLELLCRDQGSVYANYMEMINDGIARELARINLPLSLYTQWYWQMDLHNLFHFLQLRLDEHAQWEIRQYGEAIATLTRAVAPVAYTAFEKHILNGRHFSGAELDVLHGLMDGKENPLKGTARREFDAKFYGNKPAPTA